MATSTTPGTPRGLQPPDNKPVRITVPEDRKARYGDPFFPKVPFQAIFYIAAIFAVLIFLALASPAPLQSPADPLNHTLYDPKPEWYFMFLFQLLKYFSGPLIVVGTVIIPTIVVLLLLGLPFYDRNWARKINRRPAAATSMTLGMLIVIFLTWGGFGFPTPTFTSGNNLAGGSPPSGGGTTGGAQPVISSDVAAIFTAHCATCHISTHLGNLDLSSYSGIMKGGSVAPGPAITPGNHATSLLYKMIQPNGPWPGGSRMPFGGPYLTSQDITTIATWIDSVGKKGSTSSTGGKKGSTGVAGGTGSTGGTASAPVSFKNDIQTIFTAHCAACHISTQLGGLSLASYAGLMKGSTALPGKVVVPGNHAQSLFWQKVQPKGPWPGANRMPLGGPYLTDAQVNTIATWIDQGAKNN